MAEEVEEVIIISDSESEDAIEETEVVMQKDHQDEEDIIEPILVPKYPVCICDQFSPNVCQQCRAFQVKTVGIFGDILLGEVQDEDGAVKDKITRFIPSPYLGEGVTLPFNQICKVYEGKYILLSIERKEVSPSKSSLLGLCQIYLGSNLVEEEEEEIQYFYLKDVKIEDDGSFLLKCSLNNLGADNKYVKMINMLSPDLKQEEDIDKAVAISSAGICAVKCTKKRIDFDPVLGIVIGSLSSNMDPSLVHNLIQKIKTRENSSKK